MRLFPTVARVRPSIAAVLLALSLCQVGALAQATPAALSQATPVAGDVDAPAPDECRIPRPESIEFPAETVRPVAATPRPIVVEPEPFSPPEGEPADAETVAGITAAVREIVACRNAGDVARFLVFFTPTMLAELYGSPATIDPEILRGLQEGPRPVPAPRRLRIDAVDEIVVLPDGRVGAMVETSTSRREFRDYLFFVLDPETGRWLIDGSVPLK